ncbi:MAG: type I-E CRISPR-associated protein Cas7/Cse4/CasC [Acidimicrobiales bacterium]
MQTTYVDVHIIQTVPPANLNRDDTGSPKSARFGGVRRARVSSQAWKRAARLGFSEHLDPAQLAVRTRRLVELLTERFLSADLSDEHSARLARAVLASLGLKTQSDESAISQYLLFLGKAQIDAIVDSVLTLRDEIEPALEQGQEKDLAESLKQLDLLALMGGPQPADVALFGRMVADVPAINIDAAAQVAHAISTHPVELEFDYFTAVDDLNPAEETGAGMIGTVEFNSATLYRYATVNPYLLAENLGQTEAVVPTLRAFLHSWVKSIPSGHQTTFAHRTLPEFVLVTVRDDQPVNLVGAFEDPVRGNGQRGIAAASVEKLCEALDGVVAAYGHPPVLVAATALPQVREAVPANDGSVISRGALMPFDDVVEAVVSNVKALMRGSGT